MIIFEFFNAIRPNIKRYCTIYWNKHGAFKMNLLLKAQFQKSYINNNGDETIEIEEEHAAPLQKTTSYLVENIKCVIFVKKNKKLKNFLSLVN